MSYIIQHDPKSRCHHCRKTVDLLTSEWAGFLNPAFYVCWKCKKVFQVGIGEVKRDGQ